jgi:hypothetical protein
MDWQLPFVLVILALAVLYLGRAAWRTWNGAKGGCGGGCGCKTGSDAAGQSDSQPKIIPVEQLTLRGRQAKR